MGAHNRTKTDTATPDWNLTPAQELGIDLLASGHTVTDTATAVNMRRQTISVWLHSHPGFRAGLNRRRQELWNESTEKLQGLIPKALQVLQDALEGDAKLTASIHVLRACGIYGLVPSAGPTEVEDAILDASERDADRKRRTEDAHLRSMTLLDQVRAMGSTLT